MLLGRHRWVEGLKHPYFATHPVAAFVAAAELPDAPLVHIGEALLRLRATEDAVPVLVRVLRVNDLVAGEVGRLAHPAGTAALIDLCSSRPTYEALWALGWSDGPATARFLATVARAAPEEQVHLGAVDALEKMRIPAAADALAELAASGDIVATRALARLADPRATPLLLELLTRTQDIEVLEGVDGLRDLRDPDTAPELVAVLGRTTNPDILAVATHALVAMGAAAAAAAAAADQAVQRLAQSDGEDLQRAAALWRS